MDLKVSSSRFNAEAAASGTVWLTLMQVIDYAVLFFFYFALARILSPADVGSLSLLFSALAIYNTLTMLALNSAVTKFISEHYARGEDDLASAVSRRIFRLILTVSIPSLTVCLALSPIFAGWLHVNVWTCLAIFSAAFILNLTSFYGGVMFGLGLFKNVALQNIIYHLASRLPAVILAFFGLKLFGVAAGLLFGSIVCLAFSMLILRGKQKSDGSYTLNKIVSYSYPLYVGNIIGLTQGWLDVIILSAVAGLSVTGPYYLAVSGAGFLSILWIPLSSTLFPTFSSLFSSKGKGFLEAALSKSTRIVSFIVLPVSLSLAAVSPTALSIVYGNAYREVALPFSIITASAIFSAYSSLYSTSLQASGYTKPILWAGLLSTTIYITCLTVLSPSLGPVGAAISRSSMALASFLILHYMVKKHLMLIFDSKLMIKIACILTMLFAPLAFVELSIEASILLKACFELLIFTSVWVASIMLIKPLNNADRETIIEALPSKLKFLSKLL